MLCLSFQALKGIGEGFKANNSVRYVQEALDLTPQQQLAFVTARRRLLTALGTIRQQREKLILALGIALLQMAPVGTPICVPLFSWLHEC